MSIDISKLDYLVIHSGYEDRLLDYIDKIDNKLIDRDLAPVSFIKYGNETFRFDEEQKDLDIAKQICDTIHSGIGFKIDNIMDAMNIVSVIQEFDHCAFFDFTTITQFEVRFINNKKVLILSFDTESG